MNLSLSKIGKSFRHQEVLTDINFELKSGDGLVVFGHNGSGKTTLLRVVRGWVAEDKGVILIDGVNVDTDRRGESPRLRLIESAEGGFWPDMSIIDNLKYFYEGRYFVDRLNWVMNHLPLKPLMQKSFRECSRGNKQLIHLARGFMDDETSLYLVDEPLSFLDPTNTVAALRLFCAARAEGKSLIATVQENLKNEFDGFRQARLFEGRFE